MRNSQKGESVDPRTLDRRPTRGTVMRPLGLGKRKLGEHIQNAKNNRNMREKTGGRKGILDHYPKRRS